MLPENIVQLALKSRKKGLTAKEREVLEQWLLENVELQEEFHQLVECGSVVQAARLFEDIQIRDAWQNVEQKLSSRPGWKKRHLTIYWSVAATVVIMLTAGWFLFRQSPVRTEPEKVVQITPGSLKAVWVLEGGEKYELSENLGRDITNSGGATIGKDSLNTLVIQGGNSGQRSTVRVPEGGEYRVVLSDGTKVWINSGSELTFPMNFEKGERVVELKGEAYFDVSEDPERLFVVEGGGVVVKVHGTVFNMKAREKQEYVDVSLLSGLVVVENSGVSRNLNPGETAICKRNSPSIEKKTTDASIACLWTKGALRFEKKTIYELTGYLSEWYGMDIRLDPSLPTDQAYTFTITHESLEEVLCLIAKITPIEYVFDEDNTVRITRK